MVISPLLDAIDGSSGELQQMEGLVRLFGSDVELLGGAPEGRDQLNKVVASWAGWKRRPAASRFPGGEPCSAYFAKPWISTFLPLVSQRRVKLTWATDARDLYYLQAGGLTAAKAELDPPPGHSSKLRWTDEFQRVPMLHQAHAVLAIGKLDHRVLLADDMGLGKSSTAIWAWQQAGPPRVLIICPKTVKLKWRRECWATLKECDVYLIDGTPKQRATTIAQMRNAIEAVEVRRSAAIINYDLLYRLPEDQVAILERWTRDQYLICDESHYIKSKKAERTKFIFKHLAGRKDGASGRLLLSGTPIRNTSEDLWSQLQVCRPGLWSSFHQFDKMHLEHGELKLKNGQTLHPVRRTINREQLNAIVNTVQIRRKKEDVLELPDKVFSYPDFELDPPTAKIYKMMKKFALIELSELGPDTPIFAPQAKSALEATLRLEQIAQGFLGGIPEPYLEKALPLISKHAEKIAGRPGHLIFPHSAKIEWLKETIQSIVLQGGQVGVFSRFNTPLFWLEHQFPNAAILHGGMSAKERTATIDKFQAKGIQVLFIQVKVAEGFDLTAGQDVIFYGRDWSPAINSQAVDRFHRIGQKGCVNVQVPIVLDTFEQYLHKRLQAKDADAEQSLRGMTIGELKAAL